MGNGNHFNYEYEMQQEDNVVSNHVYKTELALLEYVKNGDVEQVQELCRTSFPVYPQLLDDQTKKIEEYMAVATVSLVSRTAIQAGASSAESFQLSDLYFTKIARADSISKVIELRNEAIVAFTALVSRKKHHVKANIYVGECKKYIASHIYKRILIADIADDIKINEVYLARIFKKSEGISIGDYILREKIEKAKNLLIYSDRSIMEIGDYLSFSSQSHFGKTFKKYAGVSPKQYRMENHLSNF